MCKIYVNWNKQTNSFIKVGCVYHLQFSSQSELVKIRLTSDQEGEKINLKTKTVLCLQNKPKPKSLCKSHSIFVLRISVSAQQGSGYHSDNYTHHFSYQSNPTASQFRWQGLLSVLVFLEQNKLGKWLMRHICAGFRGSVHHPVYRQIDQG